jgi:hypothetical protein
MMMPQQMEEADHKLAMQEQQRPPQLLPAMSVNPMPRHFMIEKNA